MILLQASHIEKSFGADKILDDVTFTVKENQRIGLVGANGAGKSTLLKIICGEMEPDRGQVFQAKDVSTGYLSQEGGMESRRSVWEEMMESFRPLLDREKELHDLEIKMGSQQVLADKKEYRRISEKYALLAEQFRHDGGYSFRATIKSVLQGLQFLDADYNKEISTLSGGQKTRLALAKLLMLKPDILILDEPTNYLDMDSLSWLEKYLQSYPGTILVVSHDRYFLDSLANVIFELEYTELSVYRGNYSRFLQLKAQKQEQQLADYNKYRAEKARLEEFVEKNIARDSTSGRAKAKQKQLEKMQAVEAPRTGKNKAAISFGIRRNSGREVLAVEDLSIGYGKNVIARNINFLIERGQRVALLGPNGAGKTTLLKTLAGIILPLSGFISEGFHVHMGYHDQEQEELNDQKTVLQEFWDRYPGLDEKDARAVLGRFLFSGDDVFKDVSSLSGGERSRLALAGLMCRQANFLILDEPTNHLDVYSREALEEALLDYPGTLLFVSHDRYFINRIATKVLELTAQGVTEYPGNFDYYMEKKKEPIPTGNDAVAGPGTAEDKEPGKGKLHYLRAKAKEREERKRRRRIGQLEETMQKTEERIGNLEKELYQPEVYGDYTIYREKSNELEKLKAELEECLEEWVTLEDTTGSPEEHG